MPRSEITTKTKPVIGLNIQAITTNTTTTGSAVDTADFNGGVNIVFQAGTLTDGTYTPYITECDTSGGSYTAVDDNDLVAEDPSNTSAVAPEAQAALTASNTVSKIGYVGYKRYIKVALVSTSVTSGGTLGAVVSKIGDVDPVDA